MSYHDPVRWGDEDDDENPMGRATLKRHSEAIVNDRRCGFELLPQPVCLGLSNANPNRNNNRSPDWNLTPAMMNQKWGARSPGMTTFGMTTNSGDPVHSLPARPGRPAPPLRTHHPTHKCRPHVTSLTAAARLACRNRPARHGERCAARCASVMRRWPERCKRPRAGRVDCGSVPLPEVACSGGGQSGLRDGEAAAGGAGEAR